MQRFMVLTMAVLVLSACAYMAMPLMSGSVLDSSTYRPVVGAVVVTCRSIFGQVKTWENGPVNRPSIPATRAEIVRMFTCLQGDAIEAKTMHNRRRQQSLKCASRRLVR